LYVSPDKQVRRWIFRFTSPVTLRPNETGLGMVADVPLAQAREKAGSLRRLVASGICPVQAKRAEHAVKVPATVHGFRSAFRDWASNETSFAREPVEHCLAHLVGNSVELAYRRQDALAKRRIILGAWAAYCNA